MDLIRGLRRGDQPKPGYLFLGAEPFYRNRCRTALRNATVGRDPDETAVSEVDLSEQSLEEFVSEARTCSLFAADRLVIVKNAEDGVPRTTGKAASNAKRMVAEYFNSPSEGTVVLIEATRHDPRDSGERKKLDRIRRFYGKEVVPVDLKPLTPGEAQNVGRHLARQMDIQIAPALLEGLVDMLGTDAFRVENELNKLSTFAGSGRELTWEDIESLVPEARQTGIFEFSEALADRDRGRAMRILIRMDRAGMYWPLQLNLIAGIFRQALAAKELGLTRADEIGAQLRPLGFRVWRDRARQIEGIVGRFSVQELRNALVAAHEADRTFRSTIPDDRIPVELLAMKLTG